jgi:hypothetical protein
MNDATNIATNIASAEKLVEARSRVASMSALLGLEELHVLELVAQGLARGRSTYGELRMADDARDFTSEAVAELRDAMVYVGAQLLRFHRGRSCT